MLKKISSYTLYLVLLSKITEDHGRKPVGECLRLSKCLWSTTGVNPWVSILIGFTEIIYRARREQE